MLVTTTNDKGELVTLLILEELSTPSEADIKIETSPLLEFIEK